MAEDQRPTVSIVIVSWNCAGLLERCLRSIRENVRTDAETIVVDNASADGTVAMVRDRFPGVQLIVLPENVGFGRANNAAIQVACGEHVLLLNPDTEVRGGAVEDLLRFLAQHPRAGICGPTLWNPDGTPQESVLPFPTLRNELLRQTMLYRLLRPRARHTRRVEAVAGAALCIRRPCLDAIGPLDPGFFMFYEEVEWCRRATDAGWEVWFVECAGIMHVGSAASAGDARTGTLVESVRSAVHYFRKYRGDGTIRWIRAIALLGAATRSLRAFILLLLGRDPFEQRARLAAYRRILTWAIAGGEL
jgi:hypothetical protein